MLLSAHRCVEFAHKISMNRKKIIETEFFVELYEEGIKFKQQQIPLQHIFDISYRIGDIDIGFLYLHTNQGVRSLYIRSTPDEFVRTFKQLKQSQS